MVCLLWTYSEVENWEGYTDPLSFSFLYTAAYMTLKARGSIHDEKSNITQ